MYNKFAEEVKKINRETKNPIYVGIGEISIGYTNDVLKILALGSCIGLVIYPFTDNIKDRCAVMGHIMLAQSPFHNNTLKNRWGPAKYGDKAVPLMVSKLEKEGYPRGSLKAKMVGGATLFRNEKNCMKIGEENSKIVKSTLTQEGITLLKSFTGGYTGMSLSFNIKEYLLTVTPTGGQKIIL